MLFAILAGLSVAFGWYGCATFLALMVLVDAASDIEAAVLLGHRDPDCDDSEE